MIFKIVRLKKETEEYKALGLNKDSLGLIVSEKESQCVTLFFNNSNQGDFLVRLINKSDLAETDSNLPESLCLELEKNILNDFDNFTNKDAFNNNPFNECDHVELIVEKEKYARYGHIRYKKKELSRAFRRAAAEGVAVQGALRSEKAAVAG